ncbi:MAG: NADH-quinone oxidoreductase subunit N [Nitrospirota bacterium]
MNLSLLAPELWMILLSSVVLAIDFIFPKFSKKGLAYLSIFGMALICLLLVGMADGLVSEFAFGTMFVLDPLAVFFKIFILGSTILAMMASIQAVDRLPHFQGEYYYLFLFSALGMMFMASANDFLSLFITLEFSTFGFYILVAYARDDVRSNEAGIKFFILGVLAAAFIAFGISLIYGDTGTILFSEMAGKDNQWSFGLMVGLLFVFIGIGFKIGAFPFHAWIPDVYQGAPTPVTAYLSIVPKAATLCIFLRMAFLIFSELKSDWGWLIAAISIFSMTYGNITAIAQKNMKRLLAYSGIAQIGNILIGVAAGSKMGADSVLFYLLTYLFANLGAFAVLIIYSNATGKEDIDDLAGLARRSPLMAFAMLLFLLSLAGVPPLAGFIGKVYVFAAAVEAGYIFLVTVGLINVVISFYYYLIVVKKIYSVPPEESTAIPLDMPLRLVLYVGMLGVLWLGIWPKAFIDFSVAATKVLTASLIP